MQVNTELFYDPPSFLDETTKMGVFLLILIRMQKQRRFMVMWKM
jgi:hypothetical protein